MTIIAPRHPDRGAGLAQALGAARRGAGDGPPAGGIWIADTMGELGLLFRVAPVVFVGRSLAGQSGGQNPLEPARLGCAIATGPATDNFADATLRLREAGGLTVVADATALTGWVDGDAAGPGAVPGGLGRRQSGAAERGGGAAGAAGGAAAGAGGRAMMPPVFWQHESWRSRVLAPVAAIVAGMTARRVARPGWRAPVPVLCCGNATVGGAGKTTVALDIGARLRRRGVAVHFISRGYGGQVGRRPVLVDVAAHPAALVGDEPLLLAAVAPTWVGADRAASARAAVMAGAQALVMDDGLQNPGLVQDAGLLVVDGASGFGNGRVMPAGPLRESAAAAAARCRAAILIGMDQRGARAALPRSLPVLEAWLVPDQGLHGQRVMAFAGIARPAKFHATLLQAGAIVAGAMDFPDHHRFTPKDMQAVLAKARGLEAVAVTTPKDAVRLLSPWRERVRAVGVGLAWADESAIDALLLEVVPWVG